MTDDARREAVRMLAEDHVPFDSDIDFGLACYDAGAASRNPDDTYANGSRDTHAEWIGHTKTLRAVIAEVRELCNEALNREGSVSVYETLTGILAKLKGGEAAGVGAPQSTEAAPHLTAAEGEPPAPDHEADIEWALDELRGTVIQDMIHVQYALPILRELVARVTSQYPKIHCDFAWKEAEG